VVPPREIAEAVAELEQLARERPSLAEPAGLLAALLPLLLTEQVREAAPTLTHDTATAKLAGGVPLLRDEMIALDPAGFQARWDHVCEVMSRNRQRDTARLAEALRRGDLDGQLLTSHILAGRTAAIHTQAAALGLDAGLLGLVLRLTLFPVLVKIANELDLLRQSSQWQQGHCPTCGSWPLLAELRGLEQLRWLRCGWCATEWEFPRLRCPFCDNTDHRQLGYLHVEGEEAKQRAATCARCRRYVKMLATLTALSPARLLAADVQTLHLDLVAQEQGFARAP
jgi:FdhE protein